MLGTVPVSKESRKVHWFCSPKTHGAKTKRLIQYALLERENLKMAAVQTCTRTVETVKSTEKKVTYHFFSDFM